MTNEEAPVVPPAETREQRRARQYATAIEIVREACESARFYVEQADRAARLAARIAGSGLQEAPEAPAATLKDLKAYAGAQRRCVAILEPGTTQARMCGEPIEFLPEERALRVGAYSGWYHRGNVVDHSAVLDMYVTSGAKPMPY